MPDNTGVPPNYLTERKGINAIAQAAARLQLIWRETPGGDIGIDGHLEHLEAGPGGTGRLVAIQAKSGSSYFARATRGGWIYQPSDRHAAYWEAYPTPVILVLHNPDTGLSYWADARQQLRTHAPASDRRITVSRENILEHADLVSLFGSAGSTGINYTDDLNALLTEMTRTRQSGGVTPISYFELFALGLTNIARSLYFGMDLALEIAESKADSYFVPDAPDHDFLFGFVQFLVAQNLADVNYSDCLIDWHDRQMLPHFVAPLTHRGRRLVAMVSHAEDELIAAGRFPSSGHLRVAQEAFYGIQPISFYGRPFRVSAFGNLIADHPPG